MGDMVTLWADRVLALVPRVLAQLVAGVGTLRADCVERLAAAERRAATVLSQTGGAVAVVPVVGPITHRGSMWDEFFGGANVQAITARLREAVADADVQGIVLDIDSPGGTVEGTPELADEVFAASRVKPVVAQSNSEMSSAAYWIGAQASAVHASPSAMQGSVGVWAMHQDLSALLEKMGVRVTLISAGRYKVEGNPYEPLSDEARARMQTVVDAAYDWFVRAVGRGRGVTPRDVRVNFGEGRELTAREALAAGMIDKIATLDDTVDSLQRGRVAMRPMRAEAEPEPELVLPTVDAPPVAPPVIEPVAAVPDPAALQRDRDWLELV